MCIRPIVLRVSKLRFSYFRGKKTNEIFKKQNFEMFKNLDLRKFFI